VDPDALHLIRSHCRHAATRLRRGVLGVRAAEEWLANLADACARGIPDITGSAPRVVAAGVELGLLAVMPSPKVARAVPRLIAEVSPVWETRSPRTFTAWIAQLLDPSMQRELQRRTPASQLNVVGSTPRHKARTARALRVAVDTAEHAVRELEAARSELAEKNGELHRRVLTLEREAAGRTDLKQRLAGLAKENRRLQDELLWLDGAQARSEELELRVQELRQETRAENERYQALVREHQELARSKELTLRDLETAQQALRRLEAERSQGRERERLRAELAGLRLAHTELARDRERLRACLKRSALDREAVELERDKLQEAVEQGAVIGPPGACDLPWFLQVLNGRTTFLSPTYAGDLRAVEMHSGSWSLYIENYRADDDDLLPDETDGEGRLEFYGCSSLTALMQLAEEIADDDFPSATEFHGPEWKG